MHPVMKKSKVIDALYGHILLGVCEL